MKLRRTALFGTAALAATTLLLAGCGRTDGNAAAGGDKIEDGPATGTVELWAAGGDGTELPQMFEEFQKANPDVKINMTQIPEDDFVSKMTAAISADTVPDLVYLFTEFQPTLLATGGFSPVPDLSLIHI